MTKQTFEFTSEQTEMIERLQFSIQAGEFRNGLPVGLIQEICKVFGSDNYMLNYLGTGGTRLVITHPVDENFVLKIAFNENGLEGNRDEFNDYHGAPQEIQAFLAEPRELLEDGLILEARYYEAFTEEQQLIDYDVQLNNILSRIKLVNYQDPPYHHSFGTDQDGKLIMLDYGETEKFEII